MKNTRTKSFSILSVICACLLTSGLIRIGFAGAAIANAQPDVTTDEGKVEEFERTTTEISMLMEDIRVRNSALDEREQTILDREEKLQASRDLISTELKKLEEAENSLLRTITLVESASQKDIESLTAVYESMKSKDAALLFEQMNPAFAAGFLSEMSAASAAGIMSGLTSEKAYEISVVLAGRNSGAGKE